jgi:hypothetical protein
VQVCSLECGPYIECDEFRVVPFGLDERLGNIDPERAEGRIPVDPEADRDTRLGRVADEALVERVLIDDQRRAGGATSRRAGDGGDRPGRAQALAQACAVEDWTRRRTGRVRIANPEERADVDEY